MALPADTVQGHLGAGHPAHGGDAGDDLSRAITTTFFGVFQRMRQHSARRAADYDLSITHVRALYELREPLVRERRGGSTSTRRTSPLWSTGSRTSTWWSAPATPATGVKRLVLTSRGAELSGEIMARCSPRAPSSRCWIRGSSGACSTCSRGHRVTGALSAHDARHGPELGAGVGLEPTRP